MTPAALRKYSWVNTRHSQSDTALNDVFDTLGIFESEPRHIEAHNTATICRYVELGFGIGLVVGLPSRDAPPNLYQRSLSR